MNSLTVSKSGTAWIQDMQAQGKSTADGWLNSPNAAYYASLDANAPLPKSAAELPGSLAELMKLQKNANDDNKAELADMLQKDMAKVAASRGLPPSGNIINVKA